VSAAQVPDWLRGRCGVLTYFTHRTSPRSTFAQSFATSVGSKTLKLWHAVIICAIFEFSGAVLMGSHVSDTVRKGITSHKHFKEDPEAMFLGMFCVLIAVAFWLALATRLELPVSTTHSAIGGVVGMTVVAKGWDAVIWTKVWAVVASWFISPALSAAIAVVFWMFIRFALLQIYPCCKKGGTGGAKKCTPYVRTLIFYPFIVGVTFGIQTFYIIYKGSPQLKLKTTPLWMAILIALAVGTGTALVGAATIPALMVLAEWRLARKIVDTQNAEVAALEGGEADGSDIKLATVTGTATTSDNEEANMKATAPTSSEPTKEAAPGGAREAEGEDDDTALTSQFPNRPRLGELVQLVDHADAFQSKIEVNVHVFSVKAKNVTTTVLVDKLNMNEATVKSWMPDDDEFDIHGKGMESATVNRVHDNLERFDEKAEATFSFLQILSACVDAFGHGANDVANAIAPLAAMYAVYTSGGVSKKSDVPIWCLALGGAGIVVGLLLFGHKIIRAIGVKLVAITPSRGFTVELGSAAVVILASRLGWPVSTTHCQVGAEIGIGMTDGLWPRVMSEEDIKKEEAGETSILDKSFMLGGKRRKCWMCFTVNWIQLAGVLFGWVITVVIAAITSGLAFYVLYNSPSKN